MNIVYCIYIVFAAPTSHLIKTSLDWTTSSSHTPSKPMQVSEY